MQDLWVDQDTIVVGLDGTEASWAALDWAAAEAARTGCTVAVCHAGSGALPRDLSSVEELLSRAVVRVAAVLPRERVYAHLRSGEPGRALPRLAAHARMLVLGAHTDRPDSDPLLGSTALAAVWHAHCPVVVTGAPARARPTRAERPDMPFDGHVVVGVDGSAASGAALAFGFRYAAAHRLPLAAVHVAAEHAVEYWYDDRTLETHLIGTPQVDMLDGSVDGVALAHPEVAVKRAVLAGDPGAALRRASAGAELLVIGRHGVDEDRSAVGPTARALATDPPCPVAILRAGPADQADRAGDADTDRSVPA